VEAEVVVVEAEVDVVAKDPRVVVARKKSIPFPKPRQLHLAYTVF